MLESEVDTLTFGQESMFAIAFACFSFMQILIGNLLDFGLFGLCNLSGTVKMGHRVRILFMV